MRVLLTGGTGYLGRAVARALARRGHEPVVFARSATTAIRDGVPGTAVDGDVRDRAALERASARCDALCHTAALVSVWRRDPREFDAVNVGGLRNAIDAALESGLSRIVYTSSFLALPPSDGGAPLKGNAYQRTKLAAEALAEAAVRRGAPLVRLYPGVIYGPGQATEGNLVGRLLADHLRGRLPGIVGADRLWSFAFIDDVAEAHVSACERFAPGAAYRLGGENQPQMRLYELLRDATGRPLPRRLPVWLGRLAGRVEELRAKVTNTTPLLTLGTVDVLRHDWALDSTAAIRDLDYRVTPLTEGFRPTLAEVLSLQP